MPAVAKRRITWYRSPVDRDLLAALNQRSDRKGLLQALGHLGLLALTAAAAWLSVGRLPLPVTLLLVYVHGMLWAFLLNGFHELCHKTVFRSKSLNNVFLWIVSLLSWYNPVLFWASHQEHHKWTLHPPDDLEVVLPQRLTLAAFLKAAFINPWDFAQRLAGYVRLAAGRLEGEWENALFPPSAVEERRALFNWARLHLAVHALIVVASLALEWWLVPVLVTLAPFYGGGLQWLCNNAQHTGLMDNVPDYRLCCRTILLNPLLRFVYWNMNYHTEHHMYAAVPCYNLPRLHEAMRGDLPHCPEGLAETWRGIGAILERQRTDPAYQYRAELPARPEATRGCASPDAMPGRVESRTRPAP